MKIFLSTLVALTALASIYTPAYANGMVIGCQMSKGRPVEVVSFTKEQMETFFNKTTGPQAFIGAPFLYGKDCNTASNTAPPPKKK